jgi:hypothetical protein
MASAGGATRPPVVAAARGLRLVPRPPAKASEKPAPRKRGSVMPMLISVALAERKIPVSDQFWRALCAYFLAHRELRVPQDVVWRLMEHHLEATRATARQRLRRPQVAALVDFVIELRIFRTLKEAREFVAEIIPHKTFAAVEKDHIEKGEHTGEIPEEFRRPLRSIPVARGDKKG